MKRNLLLFTVVLLIFGLISLNIFAAETILPASKIALKYQGEDTYREYEITAADLTFDPDSNTAEYGPTSVATLTDESDNLVSGVITEIKFYVTYQGEDGWIGIGAIYSTPDSAINFLPDDYELDLSTVMRKKATVRFYGGAPDHINVITPSEENL